MTDLHIDLGHVINREGEKIAVTMLARKWNDELEYVVTLGEPGQPNEPLSLHTLFDYILRDGLRDFEILGDTLLTVPCRIPAGEMRCLIRRVMSQQVVGVIALPVVQAPPAADINTQSESFDAWLFEHPDFTDPTGETLQ